MEVKYTKILHVMVCITVHRFIQAGVRYTYALTYLGVPDILLTSAILLNPIFSLLLDLVEQCWAFIDNNEVFNEDTAYLLYMDAKEKNLPEVRELMLPRIQHFFLMLVSSQDWLEMDIEDVKQILRSNYIRVNWLVLRR